MPGTSLTTETGDWCAAGTPTRPPHAGQAPSDRHRPRWTPRPLGSDGHPAWGTHMSASLDPLEPFRLTINYAADHAVVGVRGEIDLQTAPELAAVITSVIDRGHLSVVVDLAETTFMGVAGLRIIEAATDRLGPSRNGLSLRAPSAQIRRLLDITGLAESSTLITPMTSTP